MNSMRNASRQIVAAFMLYMDCIYSRILKFFKQANEFCSFLNGSLYELANPLWLWISGTEIVWFMCILYRRLTSADHALYVYLNPDVEFFFKKCLKLCSMKFWSCLGSILQQKKNCLQCSDTNLEFTTWPLPSQSTK